MSQALCNDQGCNIFLIEAESISSFYSAIHVVLFFLAFFLTLLPSLSLVYSDGPSLLHASYYSTTYRILAIISSSLSSVLHTTLARFLYFFFSHFIFSHLIQLALDASIYSLLLDLTVILWAFVTLELFFFVHNIFSFVIACSLFPTPAI